MKLMMPQNVKKIKKYRDKTPLFFKEKIESKLYEIFETEVKLASGGYLVINQTEALNIRKQTTHTFQPRTVVWQKT